MIKNIIIFEDELFDNFFPLTYTRPVFELRSGIYSLLEKIVYRFENTHLSLMCRDYLKPYVMQENQGVPVNKINTSAGALLINGRLLYSGQELPLFPDGEDRDFVLKSGNSVVMAYLSPQNLNIVKQNFKDVINCSALIKLLDRKASFREVDVEMVSFPWDLISKNNDQLNKDFVFSSSSGIIKGKLHDTCVVYDESNVFIDKNTEIMAHVVIDARKGPVYIGQNVIVKSGSYIEGPAYIGDDTIISRGYIREGSSIGQGCRIGGEVENVIIQDFSNKYHEGFLGHSYIGSWVNLGALTTTSDLKNNYSNIKVEYNGAFLDTGVKFLGSIIGDHSKTAIGTMLNTGTIVGIGCNLFGGKSFNKFVSSFSWTNGCDSELHKKDKFFNTLEVVMNRRNQSVTIAYRELLSFLWNKFNV